MADKLDEVIQATNKQFGRGTVMVMSKSRAADPIETISTGNKAIDDLTGIGGIPRGKITEIYGPESGGKSTLCLQTVAQAQKAGGKALYIDIENSLDIVYAAALGVDVENLLIGQPDCAEDALDVALSFVSSGQISIVVVDSVASLVPRAELEGDMSDTQMGLLGRVMGKALRKINQSVATTKTSLIFINQVRDKLGVMFGNPETTPGGKALKFYASLRMDIRPATQIAPSSKDSMIGDMKIKSIGTTTKISTVKNKLASPKRVCEVELIFGKGFVNG